MTPEHGTPTCDVCSNEPRYVRESGFKYRWGWQCLWDHGPQAFRDSFDPNKVLSFTSFASRDKEKGRRWQSNQRKRLAEKYPDPSVT